MEKKVLLGSLLLLILIIIIVARKEQAPAWVSIQKKYYAEQIVNLQSQKLTISDQQKKGTIAQKITELQNRQPEIINLVLPNGKVERCLTCHLGLEEISSSHPSDTFGCTVCHGGNPLSVDKDTAHANMYGGGHPGQLDTASLSCGGTAQGGTSCHGGNQEQARNEVDLVKTSLMSNKAGEIISLRQMFGLDRRKDVPNLTQEELAKLISDPLPGLNKEKQYQENCLTQCHQNGGKLPTLPSSQNKDSVKGNNGLQIIKSPDIKAEYPQGDGCGSCHVLTNSTFTYEGGDVTMQGKAGYGTVHRLTTSIPFAQCNQCHNMGLHDPISMKFTLRDDIMQVIQDKNKPDLSGQERLKDYYIPGEVFAKCEVSLDCIDCHTRQDVMGDGRLLTSEYDAVHIQCQDCHGTKNILPQTKVIRNTNDLGFEEQITNAAFPPLHIGDKIFITQKGEELPFLRLTGSSFTLVSRINGKSFTIPMVKGSSCQQNQDEQNADSCHKCHQ